MTTFADQQRPAAADAIAVERSSVRVLAVTILVVAVIDRSRRRHHLEHLVDHLDGVLDARVVRAAQSQAHQVGKIHAHQRRSHDRLAFAIAQLHLAGERAAALGAAQAHVVTLDADAVRQLRVAHIAPELQPLVPVIGQTERVLALVVRKPRHGRDQRADRRRQRERAHARILLPAILRARGAGTRDEADRRAHHVPGPRQLGLAYLAQLRRQQHRKRGLIELHPDPERLAAGKIVLWPAAIAALRCRQMRQHMTRVDHLMRGQQGKCGERRIARPHQVIAAQIVGAIAPRHAQAGDHRSRICAILVNLQHRGRQQPRIAEDIVRTRQLQLRTPVVPVLQKFGAQRSERRRQRSARPGKGTISAAGETKREDAGIVRELSGERHAAVLGAGETIGHDDPSPASRRMPLHNRS